MVDKVSGAVLAASMVATLAGCAALHVKSDVNTPVASTVQCHSFAWAGSFRGKADVLRAGVANPVNEARLRAAITSNMRTVGVEPATADADCLVGYGIGMRNVVDDFGGPYGWGWDYGWGWGGPWGWDAPYVYQEGIVGIDLYDAKTRAPIWHATVNQSLAGASGPKAEQKIDAAVAALFTKYPRSGAPVRG